MQTFNDANVDNRLRRLVRGRVIVFTTSRVVEFLEQSLNHSYPLFSTGNFQPGEGMVFMVELDGFLTFDPNSEVRIAEIGPYTCGYFDPTAVRTVVSADPYKLTSSAPYNKQYDGNGNVQTFYVNVSTDPYSQAGATINVNPPLPSYQIDDAWPNAKPWPGKSHLPAGYSCTDYNIP